MAQANCVHACRCSAGVIEMRLPGNGTDVSFACSKSPYNSDGTSGMTLLEIMIAAGIMATALVLIMGSLANIGSTGASAEERAMGASHVSSVLEEIRSTDQAGMLAYRPPAFRGLRGEAITVQYVSRVGNLVTLPIAAGVSAPAMSSPVEVRATARWQGRSGHPYRVTAATFVRW